MLTRPFSRVVEERLLALAVFGCGVPNGIFLYYFVFDHGVVRDALYNPVTRVFMAEAFLLMLIGAALIHHRGMRRPGAVAFLVLSVVGSLACSVPAFLWLASREARARDAGPA